MKLFTKSSTKLIIIPLIAVALLSACGGSSNTVEVAPIQKLSLAITDAPIDGAAVVNVQFTGVEIKPASGASLQFIFSPPMDIGLLKLQGGGSKLLLDNVEIPAGEYTWIRLLVNAEKGVDDSYIELNDDNGTIVPLWIPSGSETGLKLNHRFVVPVAGSADFTIDFDLRKSIANPVAQQIDYILRPSLRIVDNNEVGSIQGTVDSALVNAVDDDENSTCSNASAVYVFEGANVTPDDIDIDGGAVDPITTATVEVQDGIYEYSAAFLSAGDYTIAFTCQAGADVAGDDNYDPVSDLDILPGYFYGTVNVTVDADATSIHNFTVPATQP